ncbi:hypothetical protein [Thiomicrorhabdus lithotrophica]|uniref:Uncharacterized protein n=1 Tax=Thiomicrorhabdus lithotrophica TaxID=2949997 RepID=A0ABY8C8F0_9GAMM|nr:hypothetical protein [Thiomicrorhabdus lithotrophica]WEJ62230.1 hypothetical protein NR989_09440 [Thiomicrorhabdus lithotrophica]
MTKSVKSNQSHETPDSLTSLDLNSTSEPSTNVQKFAVKAPNNKMVCDEPAYLFWKIQSRLAKLTNRLRLEKRIIIDTEETKAAKMQRDAHRG